MTKKIKKLKKYATFFSIFFLFTLPLLLLDAHIGDERSDHDDIELDDEPRRESPCILKHGLVCEDET